MMSGTIRYLLYIVFSLGLGILSTQGKTDYVSNLSASIIPWLIALFAINTTITVHCITHLIRFRSFLDVNIKDVVIELKKTCVKLVVIIACIYVLLIVIQFLRGVWELGNDFLTIVQNTIVTFSLLYFVVAIFDNSMALYDLIITEDELVKKQNDDEDKGK
jgi:hypothetical protein